MLKAYFYDLKKASISSSDSVEAGGDFLKNPDLLAWIDICAPDDRDYKTLEAMNNFHPLAIEDCRHFSMFPKMDEYDDYLFLVFHDLTIDALEKFNKAGEDDRYLVIKKCYDEDFDALGIKTFEVDFFITKNTIVTVHQQEVKAITRVAESVARGKDCFRRGRDSLLHQLLDGLIDQYLDVSYAWDEAVEILEEEVVNESVRDVSEKILTLKRNHLMMRRTILHEKDIIAKLMRSGATLGVNKRAVAYLQDLHDHISRLQDNIEINREMLATIFEAYLSSVSNRMNRVMMKLTVITTIFMPLTFIAGVYGMNFKYLPEVDWQYGYLYVWILFITVALASFKYFQRQEMI